MGASDRMRVLVTGGAGFIGSHLVELLLARGEEVVVLDDFSTGKRENLPTHHKLNVLEGDVAEAEDVRAALEGCDAFVHLAAVASVEASVRDPLATNRTNLRGSIQLFEAAAELGVRRGVYASSAAVYGDSQELPLEESATKRPLSPYAADKLAGEHYLAHYRRNGKIDGVAFRFFNVFGPRQDPSSPYSGVISVFLDRAANGAPITVFGDGEQTRDFVYVGDVVAALAQALIRADDDPLDELPVFNVGRGESVSLLQLLELVGSLDGVKEPLQVSFGPARDGDIVHSLANAGRLKERFTWAPRTSLSDGLSATLAETADGIG